MSPAGHVAGGGDYQTTSPAAATIRPQPGGAARRCGATVRRIVRGEAAGEAEGAGAGAGAGAEASFAHWPARGEREAHAS